VRTVLQQLHLVEQSEAATVAAQPELLDAAVAVANTIETETLTPAAEIVVEGMREEITALKRQMFDHLEVLGQRFSAELHAAIRDSLPQAEPPPPEPRASPLPWMLALAAGLAAVVLGTLWWQGSQREVALRNDLADARATVTELSARLVPPAEDAAAEATGAPEGKPPVVAVAPVILKVPFGEAPLAGARIEKLREFAARMIAQGDRGTVEVRRYPGRFCLSGNAAEGFSMAEAATPYIKCELMADANDAALGNTAPESVAFATTLADLRKLGGDIVRFDIAEGRGDTTALAYPEIGGTPPRIPTAGEWNAAAEANNRVEIRWHPAP
jgi:hypothetical protein